MKTGLVLFFLVGLSLCWAQPSPAPSAHLVGHTAVKNQANTGTCWSFSTVSLVESQVLAAGIGEYDLSEMFVVRNIYIEKARNYVLRQGKAQFSPGGLGHDVVHALGRYGAVPESVYSGLTLGKQKHDHEEMDSTLKLYLDDVLSKRPIATNWLEGFVAILDDHLGKAPETFRWNERSYTPLSFAKEVLKFQERDYVNITSFTHHPFYEPFVLEAPDNFSNGAYYNIPLNEMVTLVKDAITAGMSVMWDADVSNKNFRQGEGYAGLGPPGEEVTVTQDVRQELFETLSTQDDHLMHIVGMETTDDGRFVFVVKNSWGKIGPFAGYIKVSEPYFALNTISLIVPRAALPSALRQKLNLD